MPAPDYEDDLVFPPNDWMHLKCHHFVEFTEKVKELEETSVKAAEIAQAASDDNEQLRQLLGECKTTLEWYAQCKCSKPMIDKEGNIFEFSDKANNALTRINEVLK